MIQTNINESIQQHSPGNNIRYPDSDQIDPDEARYLYEEHCAILLILDLPIGSEFGIDLASYQVGPNFKGVKLIPPGIHCIFASALDTRNNRHGPRCGFFYNFKPKDFVLKRWSSKDEDFDDSYRPVEAELERYTSNLRDLDRFLGPYKFSEYRNYLCLTSRLDTHLVDDLMPNCGKIRSVPFLVRNEDPDYNNLQSTSRNLDPTSDTSNLLPHLQPDKDTVIHFTDIPKSHKEAKYVVKPEQITNYNLDSSFKLERAFGSSAIGQNRLIGEFQFAFLTFIICHVYDCFEQWKTLLSLICLSEAGLANEDMCQLYLDFINILRSQIDYVPEDLFVSIDQRNNLIRTYLDTFFQNINDNLDLQHVRLRLKPIASQFRTYLEQKYEWLFELKPEDEDEPVIVASDLDN